MHEELVRRVASSPCVEADSVRVAGFRFAGQEAVHLGLAVHAQLVSELRRRQADHGLVRSGA